MQLYPLDFVSIVKEVFYFADGRKVLKDYLLKGYSINQRLNDIEQRMDNRFFQIERTIAEHDKKIGFFVRTSLPPIEGIFYNGQYVPIDIRTYRDSHDRFLVVDEMDVYHIGASLKDLGKKMFACCSKYEFGNGRMGRFILNVMLASGGYNWTIIPMERREYMFLVPKK